MPQQDGATWSRRRSWLVGLFLLLVLVAARRPLARAAGAALVIEGTPPPVEVIVVGAYADGAAVLEAADLVHAGIARRVAVFADPPDAVDREFLRRGIPYEDAAARSLQQLRALGVPETERIDGPRSGSEAEGQLLAEWCDRRGIRSAALVVTNDHSRRVRRLVNRALGKRPVRVYVRASRYSAFNPDSWWTTRDGIRIGLIEMEKLAFDLARHPFS